MAKKKSRYPIDPLDFEADWDHNRVDGLPQKGTQINEFINDSFREVARACWFADNTLYFFKSDADKQAFIDTRVPELVVYSQELSFSGEVRRVVIDNVTGSTTINAVTNQTEVNITFSFQLQRKDVTATSWDVLDDAADIVVYADGGSGYREIASYTGVERDDEITLNLRPSLLFGRNKIRVSVTARDDEHTSQSLVYTVNLANMFIENWDYQGDRKSYWYRPIIEGVSSANDYQLGGFRIVGELSKTLHVDIYADRESQTPILKLTKAIGMTSYESNPYYFNRNVGLDLSSLPATGSYVAKVYLTSGEGSAEISTKDASIEYPFMYIKQSDQGTARLVVLHDIQATVYNFSTGRLCDYSVYDQGNSQSSPVRTIQQYLGTETYKSPIVYDGTVATSQLQTVEASIDIDSSSTVAGFLSASLAITLGSATTSFITSVDNSSSYPAVDGYDLLINPSLRSNGEQHPEYIINAVNGAQYTDATWVKTSFTEGIDGWMRDKDGVSCLRITAGGKVTLPVTDFMFLRSGSNTIELVFKVENAVDADEPCLTIATNASTAGFNGVKILPERILVHSTTDNTSANDTNRGTHLVAGETYHLMVSIEPNYRQGQNLVTGWINGCEAFQFSYGGNFNIAGDLVIGSDTADINVYLIRHYSSPMWHNAAEQNYVSSLRSRDAKISEHDKISSVINTSHDVVFEKVKAAGLNYYVVEMLNGSTIPSKKNRWSKDAVGSANVEMHYGEHPEWSWRISGVETMGQGTTSMDYWMWNMRHRIDKSNSAKKCGVSYWNEQTGTWGAETQSGTVMFDGEGHPAVKRITAKINYASSMQSHKMGATKAYDELHSRMFDGRMLNDAQQAAEQAGDPMPTVAVYQYPAFGFAKVGDDYTFIGLFTIGPDKGDKPTFGYDRAEVKDTLITMEGPDHTPRLTMFAYPWDESVKYLSAEEKLCITSGGSAVSGEGGWEVGNCFGLATDDIADEESVDAKLVEIFKPAYDVVYDNSTLIFPIGLNDNSPWAGATAAEIVANVNEDLATGGTFATTSYNGSRFVHTEMEFWVEEDYTLYHYDPATNEYVAGVNLLEEFPSLPSDLTLDEQNEWFKTQRRARFMEYAPTYWNIDELIFNYVFPIVFGATDNFGKNTYPYYMSATGKWCWRQDDLDTIFDVDNNGAPSKNYWIEFADQDADGGIIFGGGASVLWNLVHECYMEDYDDGEGKGIRSFGAEMLRTMQALSGGANVYDGTVEYIKRTFWNNAQKYFPISAYNSDDATKYIDAWISGEVQKKDPLTQALGSHYDAELRYVQLRMMYVMSLFQVGPFKDYTDTTFGQIAFRPSSLQSLTLTMAAWLYPQILVGQDGNKGTARTEYGDTITYTNFAGGGQSSHYIKAADYITGIDGLSGLVLGALDEGKLTVHAKRLQSLVIGSDDEEEVTTNVTTLDLDCPALEEIDARNTQLSGELDLTNCGRVKEVLLENTEVSSVALNRGSKIETLHLPSTVVQLRLENTHFLDDLVVANWAGIRELVMEECNAIGTLESLLSAYSAEGSQLNSIKLRWRGIEDVEYTMIKALANIAAGKSASGEQRIYTMRDMEGQMKLDGGHYESDFEALELEDMTPTMTGYKEALSTIFGHPLRIFYKDEIFMTFADEEVLRVLTSHGVGTSGGITATQLANMTSIGTWFRNNTVVTEFPELNESGVTSLGGYAFNGCSNLVIDDLSLPHLTGIGEYCFVGVTIKKVSNLGSVTSLGRNGNNFGAFSNMPSLTKFVIPNTVTGLNLGEFRGDTSLVNINLGHLTSIADEAFRDCPLTETSVLDMPNLASLSWSICSATFYGTGITKIKNLGTVTRIPSSGDGSGCFFECKSLTEAILPSTLTSIERMAFRNCTALTTVVLNSVTPPSINAGFSGCSSLAHIYVPAESVETYKVASGWSGYASIISAIPE